MGGDSGSGLEIKHAMGTWVTRTPHGNRADKWVLRSKDTLGSYISLTPDTETTQITTAVCGQKYALVSRGYKLAPVIACENYLNYLCIGTWKPKYQTERKQEGNLCCAHPFISPPNGPAQLGSVTQV